MGVMSCSRRGCGIIMCDTYVPRVGYVCFDCQAEFKLYLEIHGIVLKTEREINNELTQFMETERNTFVRGKEVSVDEFFKSYTRD